MADQSAAGVDPASTPVRYEVEAAVATITLNRPRVFNALTVEMKQALLAAIDQARSDDGVRAVVLTGAGEAFCAGQDLREHAEMLATGTRGVESTVREHYGPIALGLAELPKPVVAAVNGVAAGAGAGFAFACDLRVVAESASFLMAFARVGLGADSGVSWTLQRLVGYGKAMELSLLAEPVPAKESLALGLAHRVVPASDVLPVARELATRLAAGPTVAYAGIKSQLAFAAGHSLADSLEHEAEVQARCGATADHREATAAFVAKRPPRYVGH